MPECHPGRQTRRPKDRRCGLRMPTRRIYSPPAVYTGMGTTGRSIRVPDEVWQAALDRARREETTVTAIAVAAIESYAAGGLVPGSLVELGEPDPPVAPPPVPASLSPRRPAAGPPIAATPPAAPVPGFAHDGHRLSRPLGAPGRYHCETCKGKDAWFTWPPVPDVGK